MHVDHSYPGNVNNCVFSIEEKILQMNEKRKVGSFMAGFL